MKAKKQLTPTSALEQSIIVFEEMIERKSLTKEAILRDVLGLTDVLQDCLLCEQASRAKNATEQTDPSYGKVGFVKPLCTYCVVGSAWHGGTPVDAASNMSVHHPYCVHENSPYLHLINTSTPHMGEEALTHAQECIDVLKKTLKGIKQ